MGSLSAAVDDLSRIILAIDNVETDPCATELIGALSEAGIETGSSPDQAAIDAIADWAVVEDREDVQAYPLRCEYGGQTSRGKLGSRG